MGQQGMSYEEGRRRISDLKSVPMHPQVKSNLANSLVNQVRVRHGEKAAQELRREVSR